MSHTQQHDELVGDTTGGFSSDGNRGVFGALDQRARRVTKPKRKGERGM